MTMGLKMGVKMFYQYFNDYGLLTKTGIDIPGEASTIMHQLENIGEVELATMTFGQSFQITPVQLAVMAASVVNGGRRVTPHFGVAIQNREGKVLKELEYPVTEGIVSEEVSGQMREILEKVVSEGSGIKPIWKATGLAERQQLPRHCQEVLTNIFLLSWGLLRRMTPGAGSVHRS